MTRVITVANQKGGVGKTTTSVNMAAALARQDKKVLVVDLDPQGNASTALGAEHTSGTTSSYEVLIGEAEPVDAMQPNRENGNLFCIPATIDLAGAEIELVSMASTACTTRCARAFWQSTASTTSSSTARRPWACSPSTR